MDSQSRLAKSGKEWTCYRKCDCGGQSGDGFVDPVGGVGDS